MKKSLLLSTLLFALTGCLDNSIPSTEEIKKVEINRTHTPQAIPEENTTTIVDENLTQVSHKTLEEKIGSMLMVGFMGTQAPEGSQICQDIRNYHLGGVILFDVNPTNKLLAKNIQNKAQVTQLTQQLQACSQDGKLLIAVDQEGGKVQRLKSKYGFYGKYPQANVVKHLKPKQIRAIYNQMGHELASVGINYNLAPVVDLALNPKNYVIYKLGRSYGANVDHVVQQSGVFVDAMRANGVISALKHFPGHGSSLGDTHKGYVDVTKLWKKREIKPYKGLMVEEKVDTIMVAHVFNATLDSTYPATLSESTINGLLRGELGYDGVTITDDLQMGAITNKYTLDETLKLAINAGNDILLFGNQLSVNSMVSTDQLINSVKQMVKEGAIDLSTIEKSNERIERLKERL